MDQVLSPRLGAALRANPFTPRAETSLSHPDAFVQMPLTQTNQIAEAALSHANRWREDILVAGPTVLNLYAAIDQEDTNWIVSLKDVGPETRHERRARAKRELPANMPERELTRGWLKASNRALEPTRSTPWRPWHRSRARRRAGCAWRDERVRDRDPADRQSISEGHRICLEIAAWTCRPASPERPTPSIFRTTSAAARRRCTRSTTMCDIRRTCCCP